MHTLTSFISIYEGIVPEKLCDEILAEYADSDEWTPAKVGNGIDKISARNCSCIAMYEEKIANKNKEYRQYLDRALFDCAGTAHNRYVSDHKHATIRQDTGYDLLRYEVGQYYVQHTDSFMDRPREVSCSFSLNDDYEGGEFAFFDRELKYKVPKGAALMFPANFMFPHEIMPVTNGVRYSIITWFR